MFQRVLIANRGEIALRIIRSCKELGVESVAVYSEADSESLHVKLADEAVCIGPPPATNSYLSIPNIISAAEVSGAEAIHPGYGFLAENYKFGEICQSCNLVFIGPPAHILGQVRDKAVTKQIVQKQGIPIIPGSHGVVETDQEALSTAKEIGYPVIIKAAAGGGGRGMRIAQNQSQLLKLLPVAKSEAEAAFGEPGVYLEKYIEEPRHIEVQILADNFGNVIHLGERDCSIQRRHQKLIEESPSPFVNVKLRRQLGQAATKIAKAINYQNAGTVEFLVDRQGRFYFMEINTRIQVEHPVTEAVTGIDLVKEQIKIASNEKISFAQTDINLRGHAIEFRINAEDPAQNFMPSAGIVEAFNPPGGPGVRVDSHLYTGYQIPSYYDSLLAKLIVWGNDRVEAIARADRALSEFIIVGPKTTIGFLQQVVKNAFFNKGEVYTDFIVRRMQVV